MEAEAIISHVVCDDILKNLKIKEDIQSKMTNAEVMIHQVMGGAEGQATEIEITARQIIKIKDKLNQILAKHTSQPISKIEKDTDRDFYLTPAEAKEYGLIDEIIKNHK
jgi:ATP-dependent Clp protease protease subunit